MRLELFLLALILGFVFGQTAILYPDGKASIYDMPMLNKEVNGADFADKTGK